MPPSAKVPPLASNVIEYVSAVGSTDNKKSFSSDSSNVPSSDSKKSSSPVGVSLTSSASTFSGSRDRAMMSTRTHESSRFPVFFSDIKKSSFFCLYGAKKGGDDLHLATGYRAARAPFRSVALRHRLSPAVPFSVQLLFCEPHRYLGVPKFYVHSIPDLPKNARRFSKNI